VGAGASSAGAPYSGNEGNSSIASATSAPMIPKRRHRRHEIDDLQAETSAIQRYPCSA
jgi:hypothetical protein